MKNLSSLVANHENRSSQPEMHTVLELRRKFAFHRFADLPFVIARAEMGHDNQFVFETIGPFDDVVQMRMAEFVDLLLAMFRLKKRPESPLQTDLKLPEARSIQTVCSRFA